MNNLFLGVDTSNYTTSVAVSCQDDVLLNFKKLLPVAEGERGLRQSDALFLHNKALPEAAAEMRPILATGDLKAVGVSSRPRDVEGSYMPCFLAGIAAAEMTASALGVPIYHFSHQQGHVMAALWSACRNEGKDINEFLKRQFLAFHVSGGTTELLLIEPDEEKIIAVSQIGGTKDLNAGQVIDRIGVKMGFNFPAGAKLDEAACEYRGLTDKIKISVDGLNCNLSGLENKALAIYEDTDDIRQTSAFVLKFISDTIEKLTNNAKEKYGDIPVLYAGGVMSSEFIKSRLSGYGMFSSPKFSSDNAAGISLLCGIKYRGKI